MHGIGWCIHFLFHASLAQNSLQPDTGIKTLIEINMFIVDPQVFVTSSCLHIHHIFANYLFQMKSVVPGVKYTRHSLIVEDYKTSYPLGMTRPSVMDLERCPRVRASVCVCFIGMKPVKIFRYAQCNRKLLGTCGLYYVWL